MDPLTLPSSVMILQEVFFLVFDETTFEFIFLIIRLGLLV